MKRDIPIYFDNAVIMSSPERIGSSNMNRLDVGVFTKYGNRNGSYITDEVATMLINSATTGNTPVVGFFDPASEKWAGHTGPKLANGGQTVLLVADSQNRAGNSLFHLKDYIKVLVISNK